MAKAILRLQDIETLGHVAGDIRILAKIGLVLEDRCGDDVFTARDLLSAKEFVIRAIGELSERLVKDINLASTTVMQAAH